MSNQKKADAKVQIKPKNNRKLILIAMAAILFLTIIIYSNSINNEFVNWDDTQYVVNNGNIKSLSSENINSHFSTFFHGHYHPLTLISLSLDFQIFELKAKGWHIHNLLLHLLNILLVFVFIYKLSDKKITALIVAGLFAIHPLAVESVAWISERKNLLYTFYFLLSLIMYVKYVKSSFKIKYLLLAFLFFALSLLSKSSAIVLPIVLIIIDIYLKNKIIKRNIIEKIPFIALSVLFGILALKAQAEFDTGSVKYYDRIYYSCFALWFYFKKFFIPVNLAASHPYPDVHDGSLPSVFYASPVFILIIIGVLIFAWIKFKSFRNILTFGLMFFLTNISLIAIKYPTGPNFMAERYTYVPYLGLFFIIAFLTQLSYEKLKPSRKNIPIVILLAISIFFAASTYQRTKVWNNSINLFSDVIKKYPDNYFGYFLRGSAEAQSKQYEKAIDDFNKAEKLVQNTDTNKRINADMAELYYNRGDINYSMKNIVVAIDDYTKAINKKENYYEAFNHRGVAWATKQKYDKALKDLSKAIEINHDFFEAYFNRALTKFSSGDFKGAIIDYDKTILLRPETVVLYINRGKAKFNAGLFVEACNDWQKAYSMGSAEAGPILQQYCK